MCREISEYPFHPSYIKISSSSRLEHMAALHASSGVRWSPLSRELKSSSDNPREIKARSAKIFFFSTATKMGRNPWVSGEEMEVGS